MAVGEVKITDTTTGAIIDATTFETGDVLLGVDTSATQTVRVGKALLDTVYQGLDADLTAIAGLSPTNDDIIQRKAGAWINRTMAQLASDLVSPLGSTFLKLDASNDPLTGDLNFAGLKAIAMACDNGATLPTSPAPTVGQWFLHTPTGRTVLMQYTGTVWQPIINFGTTTVYVDPTGANTQDKGFGTGTDAYLTIGYAYNQIAPLYAGNVTINVAAGTYNELVQIGGRFPATAGLSINFVGAYSVSSSGTVTSGVQGTGATRGTLTDTSKAWTVNEHVGSFVSVGASVRVIVSNTADTLTINGTFAAVPSGAYEIRAITANHSRTTGNALSFLSGTFAHTWQYMKISTSGASGGAIIGNLGQFTFTNCHLTSEGTNGVVFQGSGLVASFIQSQLSSAASGASIFNVTGNSIITSQGNLYRDRFGTKVNNCASFATGAAFLCTVANTFDNFAIGLTLAGASSISFASVAGNGYNYITNCTTGLNVTTGGVLISTTNNQYSGNTTNIAHSWALGETIIQALRNAVASFIVRGASGQTTNLQQWQDSASAVLAYVDVNGGAVFNESGNASADFRVESDTEANMIFVDANADTDGAVYLGGSTNGVKISKGGNLLLIGTATAYNDLPPNGVSIGTGASAPSFSAYNGNLRAYEFVGAATTKEMHMQWQFPHSWKAGSDIEPHVHLYVPNDGTGGVIKFGMEYTWVNIDGTEGATTTVTGTLTIAAGAGNLHKVLSFGAIVGTGKTESSVLSARLYRNPTDAADTFGSSVWLKSADIHHEVEKFGAFTAP